MTPLIPLAVSLAAIADWTTVGPVLKGVAGDKDPSLHSLGAAPGPAFSLSFQVRIVSGANWHTAGAYYGKKGDDYGFAYLSADSPQTKTQIATRKAGQSVYPQDQSLSGKWKLGKWYRFELRVRPPLANLLVDGRLCCSGGADNDAWKDVGLLVFDSAAEFKGINVRALSAAEKVVSAAVDGPRWQDCHTQPVRSWGAYFDQAAKFAASDQGIANARRDPEMGDVPPYVYHAVIDADDKLGYDGAYPAFHHALFIRAFLNCYRYYGDEKWLARARQLADWNIAHSSPPDCLYPNLPFSTVWQGKMGGFQDRDGLMLDKVGWTGLAYLRLWGTTGDSKYLEAARRIGDTLLQVQNADGSWFFRVRLHNPDPTQRYTGDQVFNFQFLKHLALVTGNSSYAASADKAWGWLERNPLKTGKWEAFYEDVDPKAGSIGNWDAIEAGLELVRRGDVKRAEEIADWVRKRYGVSRLGRGIAIREQTAYMVPMGCHTMHWCELVAALYKATGKRQYRDAVISAVNLSTGNTWKDGRAPTDIYSDQPDGCWYSLSFSPLYLGLELLADFPDQAPSNENHILSSTANVRAVRYGSVAISYETDAASTETLKLRAKPMGVSAGAKQTWDPATHVLTVTHPAGKVEVRRTR
ncbi:MAG: hypothetical protein ACHQ50_01605 [Fimbriimonadales bacterium]